MVICWGGGGGGGGLTDRWARHVLTKLKWNKRKGTTGKVESSPQFLAEEKFTFQRAISTAYQHRLSSTSIKRRYAMFPLESIHSVSKVPKMSP